MSAVVYNTYYTLYMQQGVNLYLSWKVPLVYWAYLYDSPKDLWFMKVNGTNSGPVMTGDVLQIACHLAVAGRVAFLQSRGLNDWTVEWASATQSTVMQWQIWTDADRTPGLPINVDDTVYFTNVGYDNNLLIQYLPQYPDYLTTGPGTVPCQFQIQPEGGSQLARSGGAVPKDTLKEVMA
ncbi:hypothetical protein [Dyella flagellata]|uniref:Uncharacterized protein n=1 Tax=Dyella flagellata TaxID=1867833 RepID=A0ABQ5XGE8_9GAMM|nr:hypothetical protein [Dyella flagellata]GLQ90779.1 hypothetical protein GCM10007898_43550 [Dyella flagellata]